MFIANRYYDAQPSATRPRFSGALDIPTDVRRNRLLHPLSLDQIVRQEIKSPDGKAVYPLGLNPDAEKKLMQRFIYNRGAVVIEGLQRVFSRIEDIRRFHLGLSRQMAHNATLLDACGLGRSSIFGMRVIGDANRTKRKVGHIDEAHLDCGPEDGTGCSINNDVYALLIADGPYRGVAPHEKTRLLASTLDYKKAGLAVPTVFPQLPRREEMVVYTPFYPHSGTLFLTSNVHNPDKEIDRWAHIILPQRFTPPTVKNLKLTPELITRLHAEGATEADIQKINRAMDDYKDTLEADWAKAAEPIRALLTLHSSEGKTARQRMAMYNPASAAYKLRLSQKLSGFVRRHILKDASPVYPYALFQLLAEKSGRQKATLGNYLDYIATGVVEPR